jgi:hypothetical protein
VTVGSAAVVFVLLVMCYVARQRAADKRAVETLQVQSIVYPQNCPY